MKYWVVMLFSFLIFSCQESNPRTIKNWIAASDTLVQNRIIHEQAKIDSLCLARTDSYYHIAYDSIYARRWSEMKLLLDSITTQ